MIKFLPFSWNLQSKKWKRRRRGARVVLTGGSVIYKRKLERVHSENPLQDELFFEIFFLNVPGSTCFNDFIL